MHNVIMEVHTLIPLPALQTVDVVTMNDNRVDLIVVDLIDRPASLLAQTLLRFSKDEVDLARDGLRRLRVITCNHHDFDTSKTEGPDSLADAVLRRVLERDEAAEGVVGTRVIAVVLGELIVAVVLVAGE